MCDQCEVERKYKILQFKAAGLKKVEYKFI